MAHKTLVGGTAYNVSGGKSMVSGTIYTVQKGRTLVNGTGYSIEFSNDKVPTAMYYSDDSMVFQYGNKVENGKTLSQSYTGFENKDYSSDSEPPWNLRYPKTIAFKDNFQTTSLVNWFSSIHTLITVDSSGLDIHKITNMCWCFSYSANLKSNPICGNNVANMYSAYLGCHNIAGSPVCGSNVINMASAYYSCRHLTGAPVCGNKVTNMASAYVDCYNLKGSPVCGSNVTDMNAAYYNCYNLTGSPVCGTNVIYMRSAYANCYNLTGLAVCGLKVQNAYYAYSNCKNIGGNAYFYSANITNLSGCFRYRNTSKQLNIYLPSGSITLNTARKSTPYGTSMVSEICSFTNAGAYYYNTQYNIYIYPVANVAAAAIANGDEEANANAGITTPGTTIIPGGSY